jgi:NADP-dependent 3-hydroxy acid dehydrogenase YdfG
MSSIQGKVIAITGASSGIGEATARRLAAGGARVAIGARRTDRLDLIARDIEAAGGTVISTALDVTDRDDVAAFVAKTEAAFGPIDVIINNAGVMPLSPLESLKVDEWDRMIDVNIKGVLYGIAAALPSMNARGRGHIVNVASIGAYQVSPTAAVYCATKFAVRAISDGLRQETRSLRVTTISPGTTTSELAETITDDTAREAMLAWRKICIEADAVARAIEYAVAQPDDVDVSEIVVRHTASPY